MNQLKPIKKDSSSNTSTQSSISSSSSQSSIAKTPFFEKYDQIWPNSTTHPRLSSESHQSQNVWRSPSFDSLPNWSERKDNLNSNINTTLLKKNKLLTPITSPEISPRKHSFNHRLGTQNHLQNSISSSLTKNTQSKLGIASERRAAVTSGKSALKKLDDLLAAENQSISFNQSNHQNSQSSSNYLHSSNQSFNSQTFQTQTTDLEDLMGNLMAEMSRKAELSSQILKNKSHPKHNLEILQSTSSHSKINQDLSQIQTISHNNSNQISKTQHLPSNSNQPPNSPGIKPSDSISQWGLHNSPSPTFSKSLKLPKQISEGICQRCGHAPIHRLKNSNAHQSGFCRECYAELYLPKCRKCSKPIEKGAVTDRVGKVLGKYHSNCFNCFKCSQTFPNGEFYVWDRKPVCSKHYHILAGTICCNENCAQGIEGPCVSLILEGSSVGSQTSDGSSEFSSIFNNSTRRLYHPEHFTCSRRGCQNTLHEFHFVLNGKPWCEKHAVQEENLRVFPPPSNSPAQYSQNHLPSLQGRSPIGLPSTSRMRNGPLPAVGRPMERRRTIIQNLQRR